MDKWSQSIAFQAKMVRQINHNPATSRVFTGNWPTVIGNSGITQTALAVNQGVLRKNNSNA